MWWDMTLVKTFQTSDRDTHLDAVTWIEFRLLEVGGFQPLVLRIVLAIFTDLIFSRLGHDPEVVVFRRSKLFPDLVGLDAEIQVLLLGLLSRFFRSIELRELGLADEAEILTLAVRPSARRAGLGGRLVEAAVVRAAALGAERMFLEVAEGNVAARALYARSGFVEMGRRRGYYSHADGSREDALTLVLNFAE